MFGFRSLGGILLIELFLNPTETSNALQIAR